MSQQKLGIPHLKESSVRSQNGNKWLFSGFRFGSSGLKSHKY